MTIIVVVRQMKWRDNKSNGKYFLLENDYPFRSALLTWSIFNWNRDRELADGPLKHPYDSESSALAMKEVI